MLTIEGKCNLDRVSGGKNSCILDHTSSPHSKINPVLLTSFLTKNKLFPAHNKALYKEKMDSNPGALPS